MQYALFAAERDNINPHGQQIGYMSVPVAEEKAMLKNKYLILSKTKAFFISLLMVSFLKNAYCQEIGIGYKYPETQRGVTITTAQPGKCYFKISLDKGEKVWVQVIGYLNYNLVQEVASFSYEGEGLPHGWSASGSPNILRYEVKLWKERYKMGEGPDPKNEEAYKLATDHYFLDLVDSTWADVER
jgi:hypothetical protein